MPGGLVRDRNSSTRQQGSPGAAGSFGFAIDGREPMRNRLRAALMDVRALWRINMQGTLRACDLRASRLVAVKLNSLGSPHNSPRTAPGPELFNPSSIA